MTSDGPGLPIGLKPGVRAFVYPAIILGVLGGAASQLWPDRIVAILVASNVVLLPLAVFWVLRWRTHPESLRQFQEEVAQLRQPRPLSTALRIVFAALAAVSAAATAFCALILIEAPDFWILFLPLTAMGGLVTVLFAITAWNGRDRAAAGLLP